MQLEKRLGAVALLSTCTPQELRNIVAISPQQHFNPRDMIIREGEFSDAFYFILEGQVDVFSKDKKGNITKLALLEEDDYFGEQGYMNNLIRTSSVKAVNDVTVLEISYDLLSSVFKQSEKVKEFLRKSTFGKCITNLQTQLHNIDHYVKKEIFFTPSGKTYLSYFKKDEIIFNKGDPANVVYFIASGSVLLRFTNQNGMIEEVTINKNHLFGELGVISHKQRMATAVAATTLTLITIPGADFVNASKQTIGLKSLVTAFEHVYSLPHHENITEQFISKIEDSEAIFTKYKLANNKIVICATSINYPLFTMEISGEKSDKNLQIKSKNGRTKLNVALKDNKVVGFVLAGEHHLLNQLCELLLNEIPLSSVNEEAFARFTP